MIDLIANAPIDFKKTYVVGDSYYYMTASFLKSFTGRPIFHTKLGYRIKCKFFDNNGFLYKFNMCLQGLFLNHLDFYCTTSISSLAPSHVNEIRSHANRLLIYLRIDYDYIITVTPLAKEYEIKTRYGTCSLPYDAMYGYKTGIPFLDLRSSYTLLKFCKNVTKNKKVSLHDQIKKANTVHIG